VDLKLANNLYKSIDAMHITVTFNHHQRDMAKAPQIVATLVDTTFIDAQRLKTILCITSTQ